MMMSFICIAPCIHDNAAESTERRRVHAQSNDRANGLIYRKQQIENLTLCQVVQGIDTERRFSWKRDNYNFQGSVHA